jgi:hypothetical protein
MTLEERASLLTITNEDLCEVFLAMFWAQHFKKEHLFSLKDKKKPKLVFAPDRTFFDSFYDLFFAKKDPGKSIMKPEANQKQAMEAELVSAVRFSSSSEPLDTFSLDLELVKRPEWLFEILDTISNREFAAACGLYRDHISKVKEPESENTFPLWFSQKNFNSLGKWLTACFERKIFITYIAMHSNKKWI